MALFSGGHDRDDETGRLRAELERTELRLEEVAAYYRGELDASRRRAEDDILRIQAAEAGRRRRAEEQVALLGGELEDARAEADNATRRYQELLTRIDEIEEEGKQEVRAEYDRFQTAAKAAWKTAEEEVERLDAEMLALQHRLQAEREERREMERSRERLEEEHARLDRKRQQMLLRLKKALKLSEERRRALDADPVRSGGRFAEGRANGQLDVDPSTGWGSIRLDDSDELADEFILADADGSLAEPTSAGSVAVNDKSGKVVAEEVSDQEAETLIMELDVDRKVAERQSESGHHRAAEPMHQPYPGVSPGSESPGRGWKWAVLGGCALMAALAGGLLFI